MTMMAAVAACVVLAGCGATEAEEPDYGPVPEYTELSRGPNELLVPDATTDSATAAIYDWLDQNTEGEEVVAVQVVREADAGTVVCRGEWAVSEEAAELRMGGRLESETWPAVLIACPDPMGPDQG